MTDSVQRRISDARLIKVLAEIRKGRTYGPFDTADEMIVSMKEELRKKAAAKRVLTRNPSK